MRRVPDVADALSVVAAVVERARGESGSHSAVACAVVGPAGELIAYAAADGCGILPRRLAPRKAYSTALFRRATSIVADDVRAGLDLSTLDDAFLFAGAGGVPILFDGVVVGGVGVSGATPDEDHALAAWGAARFG